MQLEAVHLKRIQALILMLLLHLFFFSSRDCVVQLTSTASSRRWTMMEHFLLSHLFQLRYPNMICDFDAHTSHWVSDSGLVISAHHLSLRLLSFGSLVSSSSCLMASRLPLFSWTCPLSSPTFSPLFLLNFSVPPTFPVPPDPPSFLRCSSGARFGEKCRLSTSHTFHLRLRPLSVKCSFY